MVIFGATGDLTKRKLFPALYNLAKDKFLSDRFAIIGVGRQEMESNEFRRQMVSDLKEYCPHSPKEDLLNGLRNVFTTPAATSTTTKNFSAILRTWSADVRAKLTISPKFLLLYGDAAGAFCKRAQKIVKNGLGTRGER